MSKTSKIVLGLSCAIAGGLTLYVNGKQWYDRNKLREGVLYDMEKRNQKKIENVYMLEKQRELTQILRKRQSEDDLVTLQLLEDGKRDEM